MQVVRTLYSGSWYYVSTDTTKWCCDDHPIAFDDVPVEARRAIVDQYAAFGKGMSFILEKIDGR